MGKIKKVASSKHDATISPAIAQFVKTGVDSPIAELPTHLASFSRKWPFPRGDLYHWIPLLDRFDEILERFIEKYGLKDGPQTKPFGSLLVDEGRPEGADAAASPEADREVIETILDFSKLLVEKCGNRSLYSSSDRLNDLLNTTSLPLLIVTLRLASCLAQRYASRFRPTNSAHYNQSLLQGHYNINLERVQKLTMQFPRPATNTSSAGLSSPLLSKSEDKVGLGLPSRPSATSKRNANDILELVKEGSEGEGSSKAPEGASGWEAWGHTKLQYYPSSTSTTTRRASQSEITVPATPHQPTTPTPLRRSTSHQTPRLTRVASAAESPTLLSSPIPAPEESVSHMKTLDISYAQLSSRSIESLLEENLPSLPQDSWYDLAHRLRIASALTTSAETRQQIIAVRALAITNLAFIYPDTVFTQKVLQQDSDEPKRLQLAYQLAELVHLGSSGDIGIPIYMQTLSLNALEALAKHKSRTADVCAALNVNVNHGILLYLARKAVADLASDEDDNYENDEWRDGLFNLLRTLTMQGTRTSDTLVSAGLISVFVDILNLRTEKSERTIPRLMEFMDSFLHSVRETFTAFASAKGFDSISDLIAYEATAAADKVSRGIEMLAEHKTPSIDYRIPYFNHQALRWLFKFVNHIMQHGGGNYDRILRNLIDSPGLLTALRTVLENARVFGSNVWSGAVNIMSSFIHNEPTSYAVIAEAGLTRSFLEAIMAQKIDATEKPAVEEGDDNPAEASGQDAEMSGGDSTAAQPSAESTNEPPKKTYNLIRDSNRPLAPGILPATEAIAAIPQAFGAICLNNSGLDLFQKSGALDCFFEIFESPEHIKFLKNDSNLLRILGSTFDEFARHHPALKPSVLSAVIAMIARVVALCKRKVGEHGAGTKIWVEGEPHPVSAGGAAGLTTEVGVPFDGTVQPDGFMNKAFEIDLPDGSKLMHDGQFSFDIKESVLENPKALDEHGLSGAHYSQPALKFLATFFESPSVCIPFVEAGGAEFVMEFLTHQAITFDFHTQHSGVDLAQVIHMMAETKPHLVLPALLRRTQDALTQLEPFWETQPVTGFFDLFTGRRPDGSAPVADGVDAEQIKAKATFYVKHLVNVHLMTDVLRECFTSPIYPTSPSRNTMPSPFNFVNLTDVYVSVAKSLSRLHGACVWEEILLQNKLPDSWAKATRVAGSVPGSAEANEILDFLPSESAAQTAATTGENTEAGASSVPSSASRVADPADPARLIRSNSLSIPPAEKAATFRNVQCLRYLLSMIPNSINEFLHHLGASLAVSKRKWADEYQRQCALAVADAIAAGAVEQLRLEQPRQSDNIHHRFAYWIVTMSSMTPLILGDTSERPRHSCLTLVLNAFHKAGGVEAFKDICGYFLETMHAETGDASPDSMSLSVAHKQSAASGVKIVLNFFAELTSEYYLDKAAQTNHISGSKRNEYGYINISQLLVSLRLDVLPTVREMWETPFIDKASSSITKTLIEILRSILDAKSEEDAYHELSDAPKPGPAVFKPYHINAQKAIALTEKGFDKELVQEALFRCLNTANAEEYCNYQNKGLPRSVRLPIPSTEFGQTAGWSASVTRPLSRSQTIQTPQSAQLDIQVSEASADDSSGHSMPPPSVPSVPAEDSNADASSVMEMSIDLGSLTNPNVEAPPSLSSSREPSQPPKREDVVLVDKLDEERFAIRSDLVEKCLDVLNVHFDVTFELADLIDAATVNARVGDDEASFRKSVGSLLVLSLVSLQMQEDTKPNGKKVAAYANFLALLLRDDKLYEATLEELKDNFEVLLGFIKIFPSSEDASSDETSPWIGQILLIIERILSEDATPKEIKWIKPGTTPEAPIAEVAEPVIPYEQKEKLFHALIEVLPKIGKDDSLALSVVRTLVMVTRDRKIAVQLAEKRNLQRLFVMIKQLPNVTDDKLQSAFMIILRHIIEDEETIRQIMKTDIIRGFRARSSRVTNTKFYVEQNADMILRNPDIFVEVSNEVLKIDRYDAQKTHQSLVLKDKYHPSNNFLEKPELESKEGAEASADGTTEAGQSKDKPKVPELKAPVVEKPDGVIHYLLSELLSYKDVEDKEPAPQQPTESTSDVEMTGGETSLPGSGASTPSPSVQKTEKTDKPEKPRFKADEHPIYIYRCFILQCLAELLASYNRTKVEFINFSRKADPLAATPSKPRSGVLNYILNALIPVGTLEHEESIAFKKRNNTSDWAVKVIVGLCLKSGEKLRDIRKTNHVDNDDEDEPELSFVRRFVLEHALKAFRDANASREALDVKYARLMCLADLFDKMLTGEDPSAVNLSDGVPTPRRQIAKMMFEKNFISAFTSSIADIDLNFPLSKRAVKYILRPLNRLTQTAIHLSETSSISTPGQTDDDEISSATSVSDVDDDREETPDLFRNSTLGMFEPNREEEWSSESEEEEDDDEMYDDGYDDEMDYEEDIGEDDGEVVSDEDEEVDMDGPIEGLPGDGGMDIEVLVTDEDDDSDDDDDDSEDDMDDDDDEDDDGHHHGQYHEEIMAGELTGDHGHDFAEGEDDWEDEDDEDDEDDESITLEEAEDAEMFNRLENELDTLAHANHNGEMPRFDNLIRVLREPADGLPALADEGLGQEDDLEDDEDMHDEDDDDDMDGDEDMDDDMDDMPDRFEDWLYEGDRDLVGQDWEWDEALGGIGNLRAARHHHHHHHGHHFRGLPSFAALMPGGLTGRAPAPLPPAYRGPRPAGRNTDDGVNPLLRPSEPSPSRQNRSRATHDQLNDFLQNFERDGLGQNISPVTLISTIANYVRGWATANPDAGGRPNTVQIQLNPGNPDGMPFSLPELPEDVTDMMGLRRNSTSAQRASRDDPQSAVNFLPAPTFKRWSEEARLIFASFAPEKALRIVNGIHNVLIPEAIEEDKQKQAKLAEERKRKEEEQLEKERQEHIKREEEEKLKKEEEEREAAARAQLEAEAEPSQETSAEPMEGVENTDTAQADDNTTPEAAPANPEPAEPTEPAPRVYTTVGGRQIDITDLEIDPEYLEALPEELREEVLLQQIQEQRSQRRRESAVRGDNGNEASATNDAPLADLDQEFLEALPEEIREELLAQEAANRHRRERETRRHAEGETIVEDMDARTFLATLDPQLRQVVLADQTDEALDALGEDIAAEARALPGRRLQQFHAIDEMGRDLGVLRQARGAVQDPGKKPQRRQIVQMLDKASVATLLRLMFMPQQGRSQLNSILQNACENRQTRAEVVSMLLSILQDGSTDVNAIDRCFAQLSLRAKNAPAQKTPIKRTLSMPPVSGANSEVTPLMVVQQCLSTLLSLTTANPHVASFFLAEHETASSLKSKSSRKGKGKEQRANKFALNALLSLLDRKLIMESSNCMEQLSSLLNSITHPLTLLLKREREREQAEAEKEKEKEKEKATADDAQMDEDKPTDATETEAMTGSSEEKKETSDDKKSAEEDKSKKRSLEPPYVPEHNLRLVVHILAARECNAKTFREALSTINNLAAIPGAKATFGKELIAQAENLSKQILIDLSELLPRIQEAQTGSEVAGLALSKFSPASADQAKLLRILHALDYIFDQKRNENKDKPSEEETADKEDLLTTLYESSTFGPLWLKLSECLNVVQQKEKMLNVATILLPLIEALMVVCKNTTLKETPISRQLRERSVVSPVPETGMEKLFFNFTEDHRKILNELVRQNPKLMSGTFSLLVKNPKVLEFDNKRNFFTRRIHSRGTEARRPQPPLQLSIRRSETFLDSFKSLYFKSADEMKYGKLSIRFHGEEGVDAGGVTREWFQVLARGMFNANYALFVPVASDRTTFHPNRLSGVNQEHLMFFKFIGRIIGKALYEGRVLDCHFSRAVYKRILGKSVSIKDMETLDLDYYKSLLWMLENDITDIITETFSVESDDFGETRVIDLIENGRNIPVTDDNKEQYIQLMVEYRLTGSVKEQLDNFLRGFHDIIPADLIAIFNEQELELLISGLPEIDVDDWKNNTEYHNYSAASPQIQWFWRAVRSFDKEERAKLLQFVTGTSKVPLNGFKELEGMNGFNRFNIHRDYGSTTRLPSSHTCFNQLDLPEYESYEVLRQRLYTAMTQGSEYFGFA